MRKIAHDEIINRKVLRTLTWDIALDREFVNRQATVKEFAIKCQINYERKGVFSAFKL